MYSVDILILTALCALIAGGLLGMIFGRRSTTGSQQARELEKRLDQLSRDKQAYENRVTEHFSETADRLNTLTDMYRGIHEHLAEGASTLCVGREDIGIKRLSVPAENPEVPADTASVEPPRDYAPRSDGEPGMLNEGFGLERDNLPGNRGAGDPDVDSTAEEPAATTAAKDEGSDPGATGDDRKGSA